ncbi:MAG: ribosome biogenesis GTPase Der [Candidatus Eremiobacteraeota bacterium]|nr:ribosome biogenesis GTPase Der [Candidatus Eremiobacteraeota bacterium]MCL5055631.1 ribosome biogenesis GTPase Der [Bacillota bacterium]
MTDEKELPRVVLIGSPNAGKSSLFNRLLGEQKSIVEKEPGVTRDFLEAVCSWRGISFILMDTGGISTSNLPLGAKVMEQVDNAVSRASLILFVLDAKKEVGIEEEEVARSLRVKFKGKPVLLVANKVDHPKDEALISDFCRLGFDFPYPVSALHGIGSGDLLDAVTARLEKRNAEIAESSLTLCLIGRPNVGKSSILNHILGESRVIVHDEPGTTRDSVDIQFNHEGALFSMIDTAGLRKRSKANHSIEFYSRTRTIQALRKSQIALLVISADEGITLQDKKIAGEISEFGKGVIILANKWDLVPGSEKHRIEKFRQYIQKELYFISYAPILPVSALTNYGLNKIMPEVQHVFQCWSQELDAAKLKSLVKEFRFFFKGMVQSIRVLGKRPPALQIKVKSRKEVHFSFQRAVEGKIREVFDLTGSPFKVKWLKSF